MQTCGTYVKNKKSKNHQVLYVKMFGDFSLEYQGKSLIAKKKKETQFALVLQLIFHSGEEGISREHLEKVLFGERTLDDANHAIHSLIYNIRKKLERTGLPKGKYIISRRGRFYWDKEIPFEEDAQLFEEYCSRACRAGDWEERIELCWKAALLYKGAFLKDSEQEGWVKEERERYHIMFRKLIEYMTELLRKKKGYIQLEKLGRHVSKAAPYEEGEMLVIEALTGMGRTEQVESLYVETVEKYRQVDMEEELCKLKDFRRKIEEQLDHPYDILDNIQENMTEQLEKVQEPYQCNWMVFREIYHMVVRMVERSGQQVQLMLCTLTDMEEHPIRSGECAEVLSRYIWESICRSIRAGDVVTRYGKGQYLVLLINTKPEDCQEIQKRIDAQFRKKDTVYEIRYSVKSVRSLNNAKDDQSLS